MRGAGSMWTKCSWVYPPLSGACVSLGNASVRAQWRRRIDRNRHQPDRAGCRDARTLPAVQGVHRIGRGAAGGLGSSIG